MKNNQSSKTFENVDKPFWYNITLAVTAIISTFLAGIFATLYAFKAIEVDPMAEFFVNQWFLCAIIFQVLSILSIALYVFIPFGIFDHWLRRDKFYFNASLKTAFAFAFVIMVLTAAAIVLEIYGKGWAKTDASEMISLDALAAGLNVLALVAFGIPSIVINACFYEHNAKDYKNLYEKNRK